MDLEIFGGKPEMGWKNLSVLIKFGIVIGIAFGIILLTAFIGQFFVNDHSLLVHRDSSAILVDSFYSNLNDEGYQDILYKIHEDWYRGQLKTEEQTIGFFKLINGEFGKVKNYSLVGWAVNNVDIFVGKDKGIHSDINLIYSVERNNGTLQETFLIYKYEKNDEYLIKRYYIDLKNE